MTNEQRTLTALLEETGDPDAAVVKLRRTGVLLYAIGAALAVGAIFLSLNPRFHYFDHLFVFMSGLVVGVGSLLRQRTHNLTIVLAHVDRESVKLRLEELSRPDADDESD